MTEPPVEVLRRWEEHGATWRLVAATGTEVVIDLLSCTGERMDELRSGDPALRALVERRRSSEDP
ncbi:MAG: hypothetical protein JWO90_308 [Solirubrobacterales bacterium]|jgi:hypothetical protein|nr:hypothetical protein [Solirubrobacterales bacterium]